MNLIAKPIVKNKLWVVTNGTQKVGNVEVTTDGYSLKLGEHELTAKSTNDISKIASIDFQNIYTSTINKLPYAIWPTTGKTYNDLFDIKRKLHVYTKDIDSKCYYAAGYFRVKMEGQWTNMFCPKYIFVQRYPYVGPFVTEAQLDEQESSII